MENNEYLKWVESHTINPEIKKQLFLMSENEIEDAFSKKLEFGTAGLRGKIGPGSNRMNHYVVAKTTIGFAEYLKEKKPSLYDKGICIAYDNRKFSQEFAALAANIFARDNIKVYIFESLRPTPQLSFMIRHLGCVGGINITASHNPSTDNGYKVYDDTGCQILPNEVNSIIRHISLITNELEIDIDNFKANNSLITFLGVEDDTTFINEVLKCSENDINYKSTGIVYTPLHGTGGTIVTKVLELAGYSHIYPLTSQMNADENFTTCSSPNPEDINAFELAIDKANNLGVNYVIATDPDADRVGVCVRRSNTDFKLLTGNELGALLLEYILSSRQEKKTLCNNSVMIDTIVTSDLGKMISKKYNIYNLSVLTGFKYIGELITEFESTLDYTFEFGYEESLGFLTKPYVRDKDAIGATLTIVEMINYYEHNGLTLLDVLDNLYKEHGYYLNKQISVVLDTKSSTERISFIMNHFRNTEITEVNNQLIKEIYDYDKQLCYRGKNKIKLMIPQSNVIKIILEDDSWIAIRPSGTEPKIKFYVASKGVDLEDAKDKILLLQNYVNRTLDNLF